MKIPNLLKLIAALICLKELIISGELQGISLFYSDNTNIVCTKSPMYDLKCQEVEQRIIDHFRKMNLQEGTWNTVHLNQTESEFTIPYDFNSPWF